MAKRHHRSHHARHHESREEMHERHGRKRELSEHRHHMIRDGHYEGMDPRRRQEMEDAGMIHEDHHAIANMPQNVIMRPYPDPYEYIPEDLDDTIRGIDRQKGMDYGQTMRHLKPKKV